jgi:hypothetical protein
MTDNEHIASPIEQLRAAGESSVPTGTCDDLPEPVTVAAGQELASEVPRRLREDER